MDHSNEDVARALLGPSFVREIFDAAGPEMQAAFHRNLRAEAERLGPTIALNAAEITLRDARAVAAEYTFSEVPGAV